MGNGQSAAVGQQVQHIQNQTQKKQEEIILEAIRKAISINTESIKSIPGLSEVQKGRLASLPAEDVKSVIQGYNQMTNQFLGNVKQLLANAKPIQVNSEGLNQVPQTIRKEAQQKINQLNKKAQQKVNQVVQNASTVDAAPMVTQAVPVVAQAQNAAANAVTAALQPPSFGQQQKIKQAQTQTQKAVDTTKDLVTQASLSALTANQLATQNPTPQNIVVAQNAQTTQQQAARLAQQAKKAQQAAKQAARVAGVPQQQRKRQQAVNQFM